MEKTDEEEKEEEMPLICDVCGKTPDVEVRNELPVLLSAHE